jgi:hypothetical protein
MVQRHGYQGAAFERTFDTYDHVDCYNFMALHDLLKLYKHGYSKVTDHASREIRHGRLTRSQALALVRRHEQVPPQYLDLFAEWLGMTALGLRFLLDQQRNPRFWSEDEPGRWRFHGWSTLQGETSNADDASTIEFTAHSRLSRNRDERYIIIGKGYPS